MKTFPSRALAAIAGLVLLASPSQTAAQEAACCQLTTSLTQDLLRGDDLSGDERFFVTQGGAPPNLHFLFDNSGSMRELPQHETFLKAGQGCSNTDFNDLQLKKAWNPLTSYPYPDQGTGFSTDPGFPDLFKNSSFYYYMQWYDSSSPTALTQLDSTAVCKNYFGYSPSSTEFKDCQTCLDTRGYYIMPGATTDKNDLAHYSSESSTENKKFVFSGNFLNFNPPKYVAARVAIKNVIKKLRRVRAGISIFNNNGDGAALLVAQNPSCKQSLGSSSFDSNRASYIQKINGISFDAATPLGEALFSIGQLFSSSDSVYTSRFGFPSGSLTSPEFKNSINAEGRSWCWGCQNSSVVIITDGYPTQDSSPSGTSWASGQTLYNKMSALNGGAVQCPDWNGDSTPDCTDTSHDRLDDVAKFLHKKDLQDHVPVTVGDMNTAGSQSLTIYGVGFGMSNPILRNASEVGGGFYRDANDISSLEAAILEIVSTVETRATSFSSAAVASFALNRTGGSLMPRFKPGQNLNTPREGFLFRFELGSESDISCVTETAAAELAAGNPYSPDINGDGDCDDLVLLDKNGKSVVEDSDGRFVLRDAPLVPATPYWEAGRQLKALASAPTQAWQKRKVWTIIDSNGDQKLDADDTPLAFSEANYAALKPYLGITDPASCGNIATLLGVAPPPPSIPVMNVDDCAKTVIRYYLGADAFNPDPALRAKDRPFLLHDIFHSSPVTVDPPISKLWCGLTLQCLQTLYQTQTPMVRYGTAPDDHDAYDEYVSVRGKREKVALVGSNGGMLHAFQNGVFESTDADTGLPIHSPGTGEELWAFIPPDMLPKLKRAANVHEYFVDNAAMVREVWVDGSGGTPKDHQKQYTEYRTVAVVGSGTGGVHRFALDLTDLLGSGSGAGRPPNQKGDFLWMWPQPCDPLALQVGESQSNFAPKPPPIGAVAMADPSGPLEVESIKAREQWVIFLNGGYDKFMSRGRGMAMLDVWTGKTMWSFFHGDGSTLSDKLRFPIAAGMAMMDLGLANSTQQTGDALFDTATVADYGGQVWTVRFHLPGIESATTGKVTNWFAARSFQATASGKDPGDHTTVAVGDGRIGEPFSQITSNVLDPLTGYLRSYIGTGDRYNLADTGGPHCRLSNMRACAQIGCIVDPVTVKITRNGAVASTSTAQLSSYKYQAGANSTPASAGACTSFEAALTWKVTPANSCTAKSNVDPVDLSTQPKVVSAWNGTAHTRENDWEQVDVPLATPQENKARYYGFWSYGIDAARRFDTQATATTFDSARKSDADLVDVSTTTANVDGSVTGPTAAQMATGWLIRYLKTDERTGSGSTVLAGCVLWNSFKPGEVTGAVCSNAGANEAAFFQAGYASGAPNCAESFKMPDNTWARSKTRTVVATPGDPAPQLRLSGGVGSLAVITLEAGNAEGSEVTASTDLLQSVFQLSLDRAEHECRHLGTGCP